MKLTKIRKDWRPGYVDYVIEARLSGRDYCVGICAREGDLISTVGRKHVAHQLRRARVEIRAVQRAYDTRAVRAEAAPHTLLESRFQPGHAP
jgi:hypothetical protein